MHRIEEQAELVVEGQKVRTTYWNLQNWKLRQKRAGKFHMAKNNLAKCRRWVRGGVD